MKMLYNSIVCFSKKEKGNLNESIADNITAFNWLRCVYGLKVSSSINGNCMFYHNFFNFYFEMIFKRWNFPWTRNKLHATNSCELITNIPVTYLNCCGQHLLATKYVCYYVTVVFSALSLMAAINNLRFHCRTQTLAANANMCGWMQNNAPTHPLINERLCMPFAFLLMCACLCLRAVVWGLAARSHCKKATHIWFHILKAC